MGQIKDLRKNLAWVFQLHFQDLYQILFSWLYPRPELTLPILGTRCG